MSKQKKSAISTATAYCEFCFRWNCKACGTENRVSENDGHVVHVCDGCGAGVRIVEVVYDNGARAKCQ